MKRRYQRCALAAGGDVATAKVGDHVDAAQFGQQGRIIGLAGKAQLGAVPNGLSMYADRADFAGAVTCAAQQLLHAACVMVRERIGAQCFALDFVMAGGLQGQQFGS